MKSKCSFILKASTALVLALLMLFGTVSSVVAATVETADTGAGGTVTNQKVYFTPYHTNEGAGWIKDNKNIGARYLYGDNNWQSENGSDTGRTQGGQRVYTVTVQEKYGGMDQLYFRHDNLENDDPNEQHAIKGWSVTTDWSGKYYNGSSWATLSYDSYSVRNNGSALTDLTFNSTTKKYTGSATLNKGTTYELNIYDGGRYWANASAGTLSANGTKTMYRYGSGGSGDGITITPAVTGTYSFEWTLNTAGNREDAGSFKVTFPTTYTVTFNANGHGTAPASQTVLSGGKATEPTTPTPTGYAFGGWYKDSDCTNAWNFNTDTVTADTVLYAKWSEDTVSVAVKAFTGGSESTTGGTVSPTSVTVGIDKSDSSVATAQAVSGYIFNGWQVVGSHINLYTDAECTAAYVAGDRTHTTIYIKTDGTSPLGSENYVRADFVNGARTYVVGTMVKDDAGNYTVAKASASSNTDDGFNATTTIANSGNVVMYGTASMSTTGDINGTDTQNPTVNFTGATNNGGSYEFTYVKYDFVGWKKFDSAQTEISGSNTTWDETDTSITPTVPATGEGYWYACYRKQYVFCAFRSYNYDAGTSGNIIFIASPPTKYQIGSAASVGYTEQGAKIAIPAGEDLKLTYTSLASSDCIDHVYYDDTDYTTATPTAENFNSSNQHEISTGISTDQSKHEVTISMTQNYKNIHIALGTKYKIFFSDYKNAIIHSKNVDDYYAPGEDVSGDTEATYLTVKAAGNASQTNKITSTDVKFYYCDSTGEFTDASGNKVDRPVEITGTDLAFETGDSVNTGATDGTARKITGTMPNTNVYVDLGLDTTYDFYLGSIMVSDTSSNKFKAWSQAADTKVKYKPASTECVTSVNTYNTTPVKVTWDSSGTAITNSADIGNGDITAVKKGDSVTLTWSYWDETHAGNYMFLGWYKGDASGPDYSKKGLISEKQTFSYTPRSNVYIYALGTRDMYINGTMSITGAESSVGNWPSTNFKMKFDPDFVNTDSTRGRYYWEITENMLNATSDPGKLTAEYNNSNGIWLQGGLYDKTSTGEGSTAKPWNRAAANSWFRIYDSATNSGVTSTSGLSYWAGIDDQVVNKTDSNGTAVLQWGKANTGDGAIDTEKQTLGLGFINYDPTSYPAYSAPIRIYAYPGHGIDVDATPVYSNLYISNGFDVGATSKDTAVTVQPVKDGAVDTGSDAFTITNVDTYTGSNEGTVTQYKPEKKNATVRITKTCTPTEKVSAFFVYDLDNDKVYSLKDVQNSDNDWYIDMTVKLQQNLYIVPIIEETSANVTVNFDATQLNKTQWGDIVTCYTWYTSGGGDALGAFPGQPMIVSDDLGSWTAKFPETKTVNGTTYTIAGITFSNYVDGNQSWLGRTSTTGKKPVMSTVTYSNPAVSGGVGSISSVADDGLIKQYNKIESGKESEYSRQNFKAQTYDYREPIAIFKNRDTSEGTETTITFAMKDGNTSLLSWRHAELKKENILNNSWGAKLNWEYLTNSTGNKYSDLNGQPLEGKPTATYYIAAKGGYIYNNGNVTAAFYSGKSYDTADHSYVNTDDYTTDNTNSYTVDGTPTGASSKNYGWVHDGCESSVSYGDSTNTSADPNDINFDYAVQWYVYDASGNFITTVLSSAFADMNTAKTQTYIKRELLDKGYAVDGKAVAICYDKPRYYYWDSASVDNGAPKGSGSGKVNSGEGFAGYRFTGQWYTTVKTEPVTVDVKVGMMTDSGEIMSENNVEPYGSATAAFSTVNGTAAHAHSADGTRSVTVALADAEKRLVKLDANPTNFIGWYYYDTNTGELEKASYDSNADFFPNFNKDVTYYALYRAAATYRYKYNGREGDQYYSVGGGDLTADEMEDNKIDWGVGQRTTDGTTGMYDMMKLAPNSAQISVFKRTFDFSGLDYTAASTYDASKDYTLDIGPFTKTVSSYNLTYYYPTSKGGKLETHSQSFQYNQTVDMQGDVATAAMQNAPDGQIFIGWYEYNASTSEYGALLTQQANYGFVMTKEMTIAAKYAAAKDTDDQTWRAFIDDNEVTRELSTATSGRYYNDTIVRFRKGTNAAAHVPQGAEVGVLILNDGKTNGNITVTDTAKLTAFANGLSGNGASAKIGSAGKTVTKLCKTITDSDGSPLTYYNRYDFALRNDYATTLGSNYTVYAYVKIGNTYSWSTVASGSYD